MAVKDDKRQLTLFASGDEEKKIHSIDHRKKCLKCGELKFSDQMSAGKSHCKACESKRKGLKRAKRFGYEYITPQERMNRAADVRGRKKAEEAESRIADRKIWKENRENEFGEWTPAIRKAMASAIGTQNQYLKSGWERKCETAVASLRIRNRRTGSGKEQRKCMTWPNRCKAAKANLKQKLRNANQGEWKKKAANAAAMAKRRNPMPNE